MTDYKHNVIVSHLFKYSLSSASTFLLILVIPWEFAFATSSAGSDLCLSGTSHCSDEDWTEKIGLGIVYLILWWKYGIDQLMKGYLAIVKTLDIEIIDLRGGCLIDLVTDLCTDVQRRVHTVGMKYPSSSAPEDRRYFSG